MNSLRTRSRSVVTEDLLQSLESAAAACIDVGMADAESLGDLVTRQSLGERHLEHDAVVVVLDLVDRPGDELARAVVALVVGGRLGVEGLALERVAGDRGV